MSPSEGRALLERFDRLDALLVAHGFPPTSPWWRRRLERFLASGKRRWMLEVGRRGGKSSTLCRLAVAVLLFGDWSIPPGDTAVVAIVSVKREEAAQRIVTLEAILKALGVAHEKRGTEIEVPERRAKFSVRTCSTTGTIGFTSIMIWGDECAHWQSGDDYANPAREVMANLRPTMATQPTAFEVMCSAPWDKENYHYELMRHGDTEGQLTDHASTWEANPTITEQQTHELEPDLVEWSRAYAAIPSDTVRSDWFTAAVDTCSAMSRCVEPVLPWVRYMVSIDPAFTKDYFGWSVASCRTLPPDPRMPRRERRLLRIHETGAWKPSDVWPDPAGRPTACAKKLAEEVCKKYHVGSISEPDGTAWVITDQFEGQSFSDLARQAGIVLQVVPWTAGQSERTQIARYRSVRLAMLEGWMQLPPDESLVSELKKVGSRLLPGGNEAIVLPRGRKDGHLDRVSALVAGASELLLRTAQPEEYAQPALDEGAQLRRQEERKILEKRMREMQADPDRWMRRAVLRGVG